MARLTADEKHRKAIVKAVKTRWHNSRQLGAARHSWVILQKTAKNEIQKIREIDESYLCLQRFDKF